MTNRVERNIQSSLASLRSQLSEIEQDLARAEDAIAKEQEIADACERRAMRAVRAGDDAAARTALIQQHKHVEAIAALQPEVSVLRGIAAECRAVLAAREP